MADFMEPLSLSINGELQNRQPEIDTVVGLNKRELKAGWNEQSLLE